MSCAAQASARTSSAIVAISCGSALQSACRRLVRGAIRAHRVRGRLSQLPGCRLWLAGDSSGRILRRVSIVSLHRAGNKDKKLAALDIVNLSIKIYFRLNTLRLCKNLMRTVDSRQFAAFDAFPAAQRVTYKFYVGRLAVFDENYVRAKGGMRMWSQAGQACERSTIACTWRSGAAEPHKCPPLKEHY